MMFYIFISNYLPKINYSFIKKIITVSLTILVFVFAKAQSSIDSVKAAVNTMFAVMKNAESTALKNIFSPSAVLQTFSHTKEAVTFVRTEMNANIGSFIGKLPIGEVDEQITFVAILNNGASAKVWTPYEVYFK